MTTTTSDKSFLERYKTPLIATAGYAILSVGWLFWTGLMFLSIAPDDAPITYTSLLIYPIAVVIGLAASYYYAGRDNRSKTLKSALLPLIAAGFVLACFVGLMFSY